jgi:hypothetical protein
MTDHDLDGRIDLALREMVADEGPAELRRRVLARIAEPPRRVASRGAMLAAAAIVVAAATGLVLRRPAVHPPATSAAHRDVPRAASPPSPPPVPTVSPATAGSVRLAVRPAPRALAGRQAPEPLDAGEVDGRDIEPIEVSPLAIVPMDGEHVTVGALRIERLQVEPLAEAQP